jgi:hypothetical protein
MSLTIEQIEEQIATLQQTLETLKNPKLEVSRSFTGQYFAPYQGLLYRRMESDGVPIWEAYLDTKKVWVLVQSQESRELEKTYLKDCVSDTKENIEEFME